MLTKENQALKNEMSASVSKWSDDLTEVRKLEAARARDLQIQSKTLQEKEFEINELK